MPGPAPMPTKLRKLMGNPSKRPIDDAAEPQPDASMPAMPPGLTGDARKAWQRLAPAMHACGLLASIDADALESYCRMYATCRTCWRQMKATGGPVVMIAGKPETNPHLKEARQLETLLHKVRSELGLNATSRTRIKTDTAESEDDIENFLKFTG